MSHVCENCGTTLSFVKVMTATLPTEISCSGCDTPIRPHAVFAWTFAAVFLIVALGIMLALKEFADLRLKLSLIGVLVWWFVAEYLYFLLLKLGVIPSNLTPKSTQQS